MKATDLTLEIEWVKIEESFEDDLTCNKIRWRLFDKYGNSVVEECSVTLYDIETCANVFQNAFEFLVHMYIISCQRK